MPESSSYRGPHEDENRLEDIQLQIEEPNKANRYKVDPTRPYVNPMQPNNSSENINEDQVNSVDVHPYSHEFANNPNKVKTQNFMDNINDEQI